MSLTEIMLQFLTWEKSSRRSQNTVWFLQFLNLKEFNVEFNVLVRTVNKKRLPSQH